MSIRVHSWLIVLALAFQALVGNAANPETGTNVFECAAAPAPESQVDQLVFAELTRLKIEPVLCSDAVFVRRACLDVIGTLPTAKEAREFIQNPDAQTKRRVLIDRLLERGEFADYWAMKWGDILRIKAEFPINLWPNAAQAYHRWVRASIVSNKPYDHFVREMLTASGSNFRVGQVNFYRAIQNRTPEGITDARQQARRALLSQMNTMGNAMSASPQLAASEEARQQAYELILGQGKEVFDLSKEKPELRVVPSSIRIRTNASTTVTVHGQRKDGFTGSIKLELKEPPPRSPSSPSNRLPGV